MGGGHDRRVRHFRRGGIRMPSTVTTTESFDPGIKEARIEKEVELRMKAGAISCKYEGSEAEGWTMKTKWNVIGEQ